MRKSTRPTIFCNIQFAIVLSHFLMLEVFYADMEECKHNSSFLRQNKPLQYVQNKTS